MHGGPSRGWKAGKGLQRHQPFNMLSHHMYCDLWFKKASLSSCLLVTASRPHGRHSLGGERGDCRSLERKLGTEAEATSEHQVGTCDRVAVTLTCKMDKHLPPRDAPCPPREPPSSRGPHRLSFSKPPLINLANTATPQNLPARRDT